MFDYEDDEDQFHFMNGEESSDDFLITSGERLDGVLDRVISRKTADPQALRIMSKIRIPEHAQLKPKLAAGLRRIAAISKGMSAAAGKLDADFMRRPNQHAGVYGTVISPGGTLDFAVTPSGGQAWYRVLGLVMTDQQVEYFGFSSLKIGGMEHVNAIQTLPAAPPVAKAVSAAGFVIRESSNVFNISPWTGYVFDNATPLTGTFVNMTVATAGDAFAVAPRLLIPIQTDPCGQSYQNVKATAAQWMGKYRRSIAGYYRPNL